mgnify:CR=1 FL=1
MKYNPEFWNALDSLVQQSEVVIDRSKGTVHPNIQILFMKWIMVI